jgi:ParB/RepB/Spo0J family partition protein
LAKSIKEVGVIEPLVLSEDPKKPGTYHVTCGSRRLAASKKAGLKSVPAVILGAVGEKGERLVSVVENLHRRDMTHIEQGEAFLALRKLGMTQLQIAESTGVSDATVSMKLALVTDLIPAAQDLVHRDAMTMTDGVALSRLSPSEQRAAVAKWSDRRKGKSSSSSTPKRRVSRIESALKKSIELWVAGDAAMAFAEASRAVREIKAALEDAAHLSEAAAATNGKASSNGKTSPAVTEGKGRARCPHCLDSLKVRYGQTRADALDEHAVDRPMCRPKIRELAKT